MICAQVGSGTWRILDQRHVDHAVEADPRWPWILAGFPGDIQTHHHGGPVCAYLCPTCGLNDDSANVGGDVFRLHPREPEIDAERSKYGFRRAKQCEERLGWSGIPLSDGTVDVRQVDRCDRERLAGSRGQAVGLVARLARSLGAKQMGRKSQRKE